MMHTINGGSSSSSMSGTDQHRQTDMLLGGRLVESIAPGCHWQPAASSSRPQPQPSRGPLEPYLEGHASAVVLSQKICRQTFGHVFAKCRSICKILSLARSAENLQYCHRRYHRTLSALLPYLVKYEYREQAFGTKVLWHVC